jgi:glycosyltransferase involved in cell wall biosynthesis
MTPHHAVGTATSTPPPLPGAPRIRFYVLCKDEAENIGKCIAALRQAGVPVTLFDSGSSDDTCTIAARERVDVVRYTYIDHCHAYNEITTATDTPFCGILDADMEVSPELVVEVLALLESADVVTCPIRMYVDGLPLPHGSLCPPKAVAFRRGRAYFEPVGHGERLVPGSRTATTSHTLRHNDLKPYAAYLASQLRYSEKFAARAAHGQRNWRDWLRFNTPLMMLVTPAYSLLVKGGILSRTGWLYAIDRLIAEALMFRRSIEARLRGRKH